MFTNITLLQILQPIRLRKSKRKNFMFSSWNPNFGHLVSSRLHNKVDGSLPANPVNDRRVANADRRVARKKFTMGGLFGDWGIWGLRPQAPKANGGLGANPPTARGWGFEGKAPSARKFCIFLQK